MARSSDPLRGAAPLREGKRLIPGELPLRGAARLAEKIWCFWGLPTPAARGCPIEGGRSSLMILEELSLRGADVRLREGGDS